MLSIASYFPSYSLENLAEPAIQVLVGPDGTIAAPVVDKLVFFNEADFYSERILKEKTAALRESLEKTDLEYERFIRQKGRRPNLDIYACFQPFNEAFKAFFPFIKSTRERLLPGDVILNLWDRTGYTACLLAGLFPEQRVISVWEGDKDTLGYKGFRFWYRDEVRETNPVQFAFVDLNGPLPFADNSISLVIGLDVFHRFPQTVFLKELFRAVKPEGTLLFPHVHLTNSEPEPFFERGCRQLHGRDYSTYFDKLMAMGERTGYLLPEPEMFLFNELGTETERRILTDPESTHYNTSIAILPARWEDRGRLQPFRFDDLAQPSTARVLINPLVKIDWKQQRVGQAADHLSGQAAYLLARHPVYLQKLVVDKALDATEIKLLYWSARLLTVAQIARKLNLDTTTVLDRLRDLQRLDIVQLLPLSAQHLRMQYFVSFQNYRVPYKEQNLRDLWDRARLHFGELPYIFSEADESEVTYAEAGELVGMIRKALAGSGLRKGDYLLIIGHKHLESLLAIQAATHLGCVVVPLDIELPEAVLRRIIETTEPAMILTDQLHAGWLSSTSQRVIQLDESEETPGVELFSDWLDTFQDDPTDIDPSFRPEHEDLACVLYTSGSTGVPKGVPLTHGQLYRSGRLITETFHWQSKDRFFSPGAFDSMSGFRNYCIAPLEVGASVVIPSPEKSNQLFGLVETMDTYRVTILGTTPALLTQLLHYQKRLTPHLRSLRNVICTGSNLSPETASECQSVFGWTPLNYYGLTETCGICLAEDADNYRLDDNTVGIPREAIAQVVDEDENVLAKGQQGELRIYSENLARTYHGSVENSLMRNGWLYTGDVARWHENGHLALMGRSRQIIKLASGQLIFASEIENVLQADTDLVSQAAVTAFLDGDKMEHIVAFVQLRPEKLETTAQDSLKKLVLDQLGKRKVPRRWIFVTELPVSSSGKILKNELLKQHKLA